MSPAAVILVMPVATVALPSPDSHHAGLVPPSSSSGSDAASYPVPSLPLHHARSCFRVYERSSAAEGRPSPPPSPPVRPPTASDNEVSALLGGACVDDVVDDLLQRHHRRRLRRHADCCDSDVSPAWHCALPASSLGGTVVQSADVTVHATAAVMNAAAFYRPSLDFNKMQKTCFARVHNGAVRKPKVVRLKKYGGDGSSTASFDHKSTVCWFRSLSLGRDVACASSHARRATCRKSITDSDDDDDRYWHSTLL